MRAHILATLAVALLCGREVHHAAVRNLAFLDIRSQLLSGRSASWSLGLGQLTPSDVAKSLVTGSVRQWTMASPLGIESSPAVERLASLGGCTGLRVAAHREMRSARWSRAVELLAAARDACPRHAFVNIELGLAYDRLGRAADAADALEAGGVGAFAREIGAVVHLTRCADCPDDARRSLQLAPGNAWGMRRVHSQTAAAGPLVLDPSVNARWSEPRLTAFAIRGALDAARADPASAAAARDLARAFADNRRFREALAVYEPLAAEPGDGGELHYLAGLAAARLPDWPRAAAHFQRALDISPARTEVLAGLARAEAALGRRDRASAIYRDAVARTACIPEALDFLGDRAAWDACAASLTTRFEGEQLPSLTGRRVADVAAGGGAVMRGHGGVLVYGPYQSLPPGTYRAVFRLRASDPLPGACVTVDVSPVADRDTGTWLAGPVSRRLSPDAIGAGAYTDVPLVFRSTGGGRFEYRVREHCGVDVDVDWIQVAPLGNVGR